MPEEIRTDGLTEVEYFIPGMFCEGCGETISDALKSVPSVRNVKLKLWRKRVAVQYETGKVQEIELRTALNQAGYAVNR